MARVDGPFLAIDWGTTNRRVYRIEDGEVRAREHDARGVTAVPRGGFEAEARAIRERMGDLPLLMAGMVGADIGWATAPYVPAPAGMEALAANLRWVDERAAIIPGVSWVDPNQNRGARGDVMRGEEVQFLGAVAAGQAPADGLLCHPGTHCKWAVMEGGRIARFTTAMTGELFALLRGHGILAAQLGGEAVVGDAFLAGVEEARRRDLTASLFGIRAAKLLGLREDADAASYLSGLLIGSDVAARLGDESGVVPIIGDPRLAPLYAAAVEAHGRETRIIDGETAFIAGIIQLAGMIA